MDQEPKKKESWMEKLGEEHAGGMAGTAPSSQRTLLSLPLLVSRDSLIPEKEASAPGELMSIQSQCGTHLFARDVSGRPQFWPMAPKGKSLGGFPMSG